MRVFASCLRAVLVSSIVVTGAAGVATSQPKPDTKQPDKPAVATVPPLVGATETQRFKASTGFVDDVIASDDKRLAYVVVDAATKAELHVVTLADNTEQIVDIAPITLRPLALRLVGSRALIIGETEDKKQIAALVELGETKDKKPAGSIVYKLKPATTITVITRDGKPRLAVHRLLITKTGKRHEVDLVAIENGLRLLAGRGLDLDAGDATVNTKLELRINHFEDGMTRVVGIKSGTWDRKENERQPDVEASYDLVTGKLATTKIADLFEQRRRFQALADAVDKLDFVRFAADNSGIQVWRGGKSRAVELDQPRLNYDPKSLQGLVNADGSAWILLKVDPVNNDAVARKKADPEYLDIFTVGPGADAKAVRKARVLATGVRHRFGVVGTKVWLLERNTGFERGGKNIAVYQLP